MNVTIGDSFVLPFGAGAGGDTFTTSLGSPPQTHSPQGPYYWWTVAGNVFGNDLRLDQNPSINPTTFAGTYLADFEGTVICGQGVFFDQGIQVFFDQPSQFTVPQFSGPAMAAVAVSFALLALTQRKKSSGLPA